MDRRINELSALYSISRNISSTLSLERVVSSTFEELSKAVASDLILLYLRNGNKIILERTWPASEQFKDLGLQTKSVGKCICGLAGGGKPIYSKDIHTDPNCTLDDCKEAGIRSLAALPLPGYDGVVGVLTLLSLSERDFSEQSSFLETVAAQIAIALQNAIMYEKVQRRAKELERSIAKRREAEEKLQKSEAYYRQLLDSMHDAVAVGDADGVLTYVNRSFCKLFGLETGELIGRKVADLLDETNRNRWLEQQARRKRRISSTYELQISRKDGGAVSRIEE